MGKKKVLVTGGAGYIGSHTVECLLAEGYSPIIVDDLSSGHKEAVVGGEFVKANIGDKKAMDEIFKKYKPDSVIHFAGFIEAGESMNRPKDFFANNVVCGLNLLDVMLENGVKKIVFSSSAGVYGEPEQVPITENCSKKPTNVYGLTKLIFEQVLESYKNAYGLTYVALRYFNAAGADPKGKLGADHKHKTHLITRALLAAVGKIPHLDVFGTDYPTKDGTCIRDYIHVNDLANAHILALNKLESGESAIYNLGSEKGFSVKEIINVVEETTGKKLNVVLSPRRAGDSAVLVASSEKIRNELGWQPKYSDIHTIVKTAWDWQKSHPEGYAKYIR